MTDSEQTSFADLGKVLVIIPTYNESENIEPIVSRLRAAVPDVDVLIADDNSPDGTGDIADTLAEHDPHVQVMHRAGKEGLGAAYIAGFRWGIDRGYDILVEMDADGSHQPEQLPRLLEAVRDADLVLGSRWVPGGGAVNWPGHRKLISRGGSTYSRLMLGVDIHDVTGGFRAFRKDTLLGIGLDEVASQGYCFQVDLAWRAIRKGYRVLEVPITFIERERGNSKMSNSIVAEALWRVTAWGVGRRVGKYPDEATPEAAAGIEGGAEGASRVDSAREGHDAPGTGATDTAGATGAVDTAESAGSPDTAEAADTSSTTGTTGTTSPRK